MFGVDFNGCDMCAGTSEPDGGIATQSADLEDVLGVYKFALDGEVLTL